MSRSFLFFFMIMMLMSLTLSLPESYGQLSSGDILVADEFGGTDNKGVIYRVDPVTGTYNVFSDFGDATQGPIGDDPSDIAVEASGSILVIDENAGTDSEGGTDYNGALFRIDPVTGVRTLLSDFGDATQGPLGDAPVGVAVEASGNILVIDEDGFLFRVNPSTGSRTILSDFSDGGQGPTGDNPVGVAVESSGNILVIDEEAGTGGLGALFRVHPVTGVRTLLSDFGDGNGPNGDDPESVAVEASGNILVVDEGVGTGNNGVLFRIDPVTGVRTILSDFGNGSQGPAGIDPVGVAIELSGNILVSDESEDVLFRVNPVTGARTILSDFGSANLEGIAVYTAPAPVGGISTPINKLAILMPYIALAGLVIVVSTVYLIKRRKD